MAHYPTGLDYIQVEHGGQIILHPPASGDVTLTRIEGDESGAVFVMNTTTVTIGKNNFFSNIKNMLIFI